MGRNRMITFHLHVRQASSRRESAEPRDRFARIWHFSHARAKKNLPALALF